MPPYHHKNLGHALVRRAIERLDQPGDGTISMRAVAKDVGVTAMAPYNHFDGKADFLDEVAAEGFRMLSVEIGRVQKVSDTLEGVISAYITVYLEYSRKHPRLFNMLFETGTRDPDSRARKASRHVFDDVCEALTEVSTEKSPAAVASLANLVFAVAHGITVLSERNMLRSVEEGTESVEQMISHASRALAANWLS